MSEDIEPICIQPTSKNDVPEVLGMINDKPGALLEVNADTILEWIDQGHSLVGKTKSGILVAHQALKVWEKEKLIEGRSAIVKPEYRDRRYVSAMKKAIDEIAAALYPGYGMVSFTERESKIRGIVQRAGYRELPMTKVPDAMFADCPSECVKKTGIDCGCIVFVKKPQ